MPNYVLNRDYLLRTPNGVVSFIKGTPTWVPPHLERDARGIGAEAAEGENAPLLDPEKTLPPIPQGDERVEQIKIAFDALVERNESTDFTGAGSPTVNAVKAIVGFNVDRPEIDELWAMYKQEKAA